MSFSKSLLQHSFAYWLLYVALFGGTAYLCTLNINIGIFAFIFYFLISLVTAKLPIIFRGGWAYDTMGDTLYTGWKAILRSIFVMTITLAILIYFIYTDHYILNFDLKTFLAILTALVCALIIHLVGVKYTSLRKTELKEEALRKY